MLKTCVGGVETDCCIYNASGPRTGSIEALQKIAQKRSGIVLSKSATLVKQDGNSLPRFVNNIDLGSGTQGSLNSEGLPNAGIDYYISDLAIDGLKPFNKPYFVSLSGLSLEDNLEMLERASNTPGVAGIELNLACPNIPGKPIIAYDFDQMDFVLAKICAHPDFERKPLGVKLAPYFDAPFFQRAADVLAKYPIKFVVCINTIGNGLLVDADKECAMISPKGGLGGLGGGYVKPTALANVNMMSRLLAERGRTDIDIVGVGGISTGKDAFEMILCGAAAVQIGTCHWTEGPSCFDRIAYELEDIMRVKGYTSINDFRGKLKPYVKSPVKTKSEADSKKGAGLKNENHSPTIERFIIAFLVVLIAALIGERFDALTIPFPSGNTMK